MSGPDRETREHLGRVADGLDRGQAHGRRGWGLFGHCAGAWIDETRPLFSNTDAWDVLDAYCDEKWGRDLVQANDGGLLKPEHVREAAGPGPGEEVRPQTPEETTIRPPKGRQRSSAATALVVVVALVALLGMLVQLARKVAVVLTEFARAFIEFTVQVAPWVGGGSLVVLLAVHVDWRRVRLPRRAPVEVDRTEVAGELTAAEHDELMQQWTRAPEPVPIWKER